MISYDIVLTVQFKLSQRVFVIYFSFFHHGLVGDPLGELPGVTPYTNKLTATW